MYRMYVDFCADKGYSTVKESMYRRVFNICYNLSFHARKKDKCNYCVAYENSTKQMQTEQKDAYKTHLRNKTEARLVKSADKLRDQEDKSFSAACFDLQQVL